MSDEAFAAVGRDFASIAEDFCQFVSGHSRVSVQEFVDGLLDKLPRLYTACLLLPVQEDAKTEEEVDDQDVDESEPTEPRSLVEDLCRNSEDYRRPWQKLYKSLTDYFDPHVHYCEVFNPWREEESVHGSLADDLSDICRELSDGLFEWRAKNVKDAVWQWQSGFASHFGMHIVDCLRALHYLKFHFDEK